MILISSDLPEVMGLSHRLALYRDGRIVREVAGLGDDCRGCHGRADRSKLKPHLMPVETCPKHGIMHLDLLAAIVVLLLRCSAFWVPQFLSLENLLDLAQQISINAVLAFGMTLVILIGGIDLSVGAVVALIGTITVWLLPRVGLGGAVAAGLAAATVFGAVNGICAARTRDAAVHHHAGHDADRPRPGIAVQRGPADRRARSARRHSWRWATRGSSGVVPVPVLVMAAAFVVTRGAAAPHAVRPAPLRDRRQSRGGPATRDSPGPATRSRSMSPARCSPASPGMIHASQLYSAEPGSGQGFELNAIAAVVVGGTSFTGGIGIDARHVPGRRSSSAFSTRA